MTEKVPLHFPSRQQAVIISKLLSNSCHTSLLTILDARLQWRSKVGGWQVGARALGRRPWGRTSTLFAVFKNTF